MNDLQPLGYRVTVVTRFRAYHRLVGADFGAENQLHHHDYRLELTLRGDALDEYNYLVDITLVESRLAAFVTEVAETTLNDHTDCHGNPSVEWLSRLAWGKLTDRMPPQVRWAEVCIWEHETAAAAYAAPVG